MPGIASSYIFTLKPGDKVLMSGPYGDFHPIFDSKKEMIWWHQAQFALWGHPELLDRTLAWYHHG